MNHKKIFASLFCAMFLLQAGPVRAQALDIHLPTLLIGAVIYTQWDNIEKYWKEITAAALTTAGIGYYWTRHQAKPQEGKIDTSLKPRKQKPSSWEGLSSEEQLLFMTQIAFAGPLAAPGSTALIPMRMPPAQPLLTFHPQQPAILYHTLQQPHERALMPTPQRLGSELTSEEMIVLLRLIEDQQKKKTNRVKELSED